MKKFGLIMSMMLVIMGLANAQRTVVGMVSDQDGEALIGATVLVKGTSAGTVTDIDGKYSIEVPEGSNILVFSYTGFETQEVELGASNVVNIDLAEGVTLSEAVVTALGVEREKKALGYATQQVDGEELTKVKDANFINSLSGKIAGVDIKRGTNLGGSSNVIIRGYASITENNQALFVVDGIPINNEITNTNDQMAGRGGYDYGNSAMDINPEDVESVSVLRGAAASALYGARGANGVILITTKKGTKRKGLGVTFSTGLTAASIDKSTFPKYQNQYGAGYSTVQPDFYDTDPTYDPDDEYPNGWSLYDFGDGVKLTANVFEDASYGPAFDPNLMVYDWRSFYPELSTFGQLQQWTAAENGPETFYETGLTYNNSISVDGGTDKGTFRLGYTNFDQSGVLPNSRIKRNTVNFAGGYDLTDKLNVSSTITFTNTQGKGRYGTGYDSRNVNQSFRQWYQVNADIQQLKDAYDQTGKNLTWNPYGSLDPNNPTQPHYFDNYYWTVYENYNNDERNRIFGNISATYEFTDWLNVLGRVGLDSYNEVQEERIAVGSVDVPLYRRRNFDVSEANYDLMLNFNKYFGSSNDFNLNGTIGTNIRRNSFSRITAETNGGLVVPGVYSLSNSSSQPEAPDEYVEERAVNGYYGRVGLGYQNFLYLDGTYRYDVSSTLPVNDNAFGYYSGTLSFVFSELLNVDAINLGKFRLNYAEVGNDAPALSIYETFDLNTPFGSANLASASNTRKNPNLVPERTKSFEVGLEMSLLKNRVGFDLSYYDSRSINQILPVSVTGATGQLFQFVNAGEMKNTGIELTLNLTPVKTSKFRWDMNINWAKNNNEVIKLFGEGDNEVKNYLISSAQGGISFNATVGEPFGAIWGTNFVYHTDGQPIVYPHPFGGVRYRKTASPEVIGDINPDWRGGINNAFSYQNLRLSFLIDVQKGGEFFSLDTWYGYATGLYDVTAGTNDKGNPVRALPDDGGGLPIGGVLQTGTNEDGIAISDGTPNTEYAYVSDVYNTFGYVYAPNAYHIYDAGFVKLREVAITYSFPKRLFQNSVIGGLDLSLVGRNLWIIWKDSPYSDPEAGLSGGTYQQGNQSGAYPAVKEYGVNLTVKF
ncbi:MAG: SusC/RagA family TonB-linked outer membrane protein [Saprospiraceae bacterium]